MCPEFFFMHKTRWGTAMYCDPIAATEDYDEVLTTAAQSFSNFGKLALKNITWQTQTFHFSQDFWNRTRVISGLRLKEKTHRLQNDPLCKPDFPAWIWAAECAGSGQISISQTKRTVKAFVQIIPHQRYPSEKEKQLP